VFFSLSILVVLAAFDLAGQLIDFEMGFGFAQTAAPQTRANTTVLSAFTQLLAFMIFLSVNGHLLAIQVLVHSFKTIPVGSFALNAGLFRRMLLLSGGLFVLAVKLASPVLAVLILAQAAMGLMTKFAPQVNMFSVSFPLTITLGMLFLGLTLICWGEVGSQTFALLFDFLRLSTQ
jgi:flagellar biosynthetic protein FliR